MKPVLVWETKRKTTDTKERNGNVVPLDRHRSSEVVEQESLRTEWTVGAGKDEASGDEAVTITMVSSGFTTKQRATAPQASFGSMQMRLAA